jgi:uncharacterized protein YegP (UPF0339 family)
MKRSIFLSKRFSSGLAWALALAGTGVGLAVKPCPADVKEYGEYLARVKAKNAEIIADAELQNRAKEQFLEDLRANGANETAIQMILEKHPEDRAETAPPPLTEPYTEPQYDRIKMVAGGAINVVNGGVGMLGGMAAGVVSQIALALCGLKKTKKQENEQAV